MFRTPPCGFLSLGERVTRQAVALSFSGPCARDTMRHMKRSELRYRRLGYKHYVVIYLGAVAGTIQYNSVTKWTAQKPSGAYRMHETFKSDALYWLLNS